MNKFLLNIEVYFSIPQTYLVWGILAYEQVFLRLFTFGILAFRQDWLRSVSLTEFLHSVHYPCAGYRFYYSAIVWPSDCWTAEVLTCGCGMSTHMLLLSLAYTEDTICKENSLKSVENDEIINNFFSSFNYSINSFYYWFI